ncbi:hypothetical protein EV385_3375 [Krasilnikovia cinnamomea]|uniref:Nucleotidyltransferase-like protein n=1 Tax=Krasilnikovia cinnamomea TaxID=349313 RepID=A0A4Q7ZMG1_9ACTN|nr:hypothetical protein [Krasilnikovia cinnamomea]RZU51545.1 hypothetical protein EV385_3375 [Krasilnikovia cinnamomea]
MDPAYVAARQALLTALIALDRSPSPVVLIGAQAVYLRTGQASFDVSVDPYTTDADLALNPDVLGGEPQLEQVMRAAGFDRLSQPGAWFTHVRMPDGTTRSVEVDLMVPEAVAGPGRRAARLPEQAAGVARRGPGLEAAIIDYSRMTVPSLDKSDRRTAEVNVAGTAALLIAKAHKLFERIGDERKRGQPSDRVKPKDAGDIYRLASLAEPAEDIGRRLRALAEHEMAGGTVRSGVDYLSELFSRRGQRGVELAKVALSAPGGVPPTRIEAVLSNYMRELREAYDDR